MWWIFLQLFEKPPDWFLQCLHKIASPLTMSKCSSFPHPFICSSVLLILTTQIGVRWNLKVVLIYISLTLSTSKTVSQAFIFPFFESSLFSSMLYFYWIACFLDDLGSELFVFRSLYSVDISSLNGKDFFRLVGCIFTSVMVSFDLQDLSWGPIYQLLVLIRYLDPIWKVVSYAYSLKHILSFSIRFGIYV